MSLSHAFFAIIRRDLVLALRRRSEIANPLLFFILVITLFPLGIGAQPHLLQAIAPGIIWVSALLAAMLSLDSLFRSDFDDGSLEQMLLSPHPTSVLVLGKIIAHWLVTGLPLLIVAPLLAVFLGMPNHALGILLLTLLLGNAGVKFNRSHRCCVNRWTASGRHDFVAAGFTLVCSCA